MKIKNIGIVGIINTLDKYGNKKLPQRISFAITKNTIIFKKEYETYEASLKKLFEKYEPYCLKNDKGEMIIDENGLPTVSKDKVADFAEELNELLSIEVDVEPYTISEDVFDYTDESCRYDAMSASDIITLQSVLCVKEEK